MRCVDLGFKTALIVTPVNVLHNWRIEFMKWRPSEVKPLRIFMLEDVSRYRFFYERSFWLQIFYALKPNSLVATNYRE